MTVAQGTPRCDEFFDSLQDMSTTKRFCRELERENAALSAQVVELTISRDDKYQRLKDVTEQWQKDVARAEAAEAQMVELQKDAERWRWVRKQTHIDVAACYFLPLPCDANTAEEIDAEIDKAMTLHSDIAVPPSVKDSE